MADKLRASGSRSWVGRLQAQRGAERSSGRPPAAKVELQAGAPLGRAFPDRASLDDGLLQHRGALQGGGDGGDGAAACEAGRAVEELLQRLAGRPNLSTLLAVLPNWAEQLDVSGTAASRAERSANLGRLIDLIERSTPR